MDTKRVTKRDTMTLPDYDIDTNLDTETFIEEIKCRRLIWDSTCAEYTNRVLKNLCWSRLVDKYGPNLTKIEKREFGALLKKKYKSLRACFTRELKRQAGLSSDRRKSEYMYFHKLHFLESVVCPRDIVTRAEPDQDKYTSMPLTSAEKMKRYRKKLKKDPDRYEEYKKKDLERIMKKKKKVSDGELFRNAESEEDSKIKKRRLTRNTRAKETDPLSEVPPRREEAETSAQFEDEDRLFLLSLLNPLKSVPKHKKMSVKIKIMSAIDEVTQEDDVFIEHNIIKTDYDSDVED